MVFRDNPLFNQTLTNQNVLGSILEVVRQMRVLGASVLENVVTATPGAFAGQGDGVVNVGVRRPADGGINQFIIAETLTFLCTRDSYLDGATPGNEGFRVTGEGAQNDLFAFNWPLGSNCQADFSAINPGGDNSQGNLLTNSDFEDWSVTDYPDNWVIVVGNPSVNVFEENSIVEGTAHAVRIEGDDTTLVELTQRFDSTAGTRGSLSPETQYSFCVFLRRGGTILTAGVMEICLLDENANIINDNAGNPNSFTIDLTQLTVNYIAYKGTFRTPTEMPSFSFLCWRLTTAVNSGGLLYVEKMGMGLMTRLYVGGPYVAVHSGGVPFLAGDYAYTTLTNARGDSHGNSGGMDTWQTAFMRLLDPLILANNIILPSSDTPTISDTLLN